MHLVINFPSYKGRAKVFYLLSFFPPKLRNIIWSSITSPAVERHPCQVFIIYLRLLFARYQEYVTATCELVDSTVIAPIKSNLYREAFIVFYMVKVYSVAGYGGIDAAVSAPFREHR